MSLSAHPVASHGDALVDLRRLIAHRARQCGLDLEDRQSLSRFLYTESAAGTDPTAELRAMLILLYRLEACSSEDLGHSALLDLWRRHDDFLLRHCAPATPRNAPIANRQAA
jgi:hypothetical protein